MATFISDDFTDIAGTLLSLHTPTVAGGSWTLDTNINAAGSMVITDANRVRPAIAGAAASVYYTSTSPASADYTLSCTLHFFTNTGSGTGYAGLAARLDTSLSTYGYIGIYNFTAAQWEIRTGAGGQVGTPFPAVLTAGTDYSIQFTLQGTLLSLFVNSILVVQGTSAYQSAAGKAGVIGYGTFTNSTGIHIDDVIAVDGVVNPIFGHMAGDSITFGQGASNNGHRWSTLYATSQVLAESNRAVSATQIVDQTSTSVAVNRNQIYQTLGVSASDVRAWLTGYNDVRFFGTDANGMETYKRVLRSAVAWMSRQVSDCKQGSTGAFSGSWTTTVINGVSTKFSSTIGNTATYVVSGRSVTLSYLSHFGAADGGTFSVTIDGVVMQTGIDTNFGSSSGYGGASPTLYAPMALRWNSLSPGPHTVVVTVTSAAIVQVCFVCGANEAVTPLVVLCGPLKMNATGYAAGSPYNNSSDYAVWLYSQAIKDIVTDANRDGRRVHYGETNDYYQIANVGGDNIHPADAGHDQIYKSFVSARRLWKRPRRVSGRLGMRS